MKLANHKTDLPGRFGNDSSQAGQITVYRVEEFDRPVSFPHIRRDFYKIELLTAAQGILGYADQRVVVQDKVLIFANPLIPYSWDRTAGRETGFVCLFNESFITPSLRTSPVAGSPLFSVGGNPVLFPSSTIVDRLTTFFEQMLAEMASPYINKYDLMRNYVQLIIHEALKVAPAGSAYQPGTSATRISTQFRQLLDRQFPIVSPQHTMQLKNANEFARQLGVHTNHLNKALKETTAKTTTEHIVEKLLDEAKALLRHSDWSVAEIGYCLGFEHASNFNSFFRKHMGYPPNQYRRQPNATS